MTKAKAVNYNDTIITYIKDPSYLEDTYLVDNRTLKSSVDFINRIKYACDSKIRELRLVKGNETKRPSEIKLKASDIVDMLISFFDIKVDTTYIDNFIIADYLYIRNFASYVIENGKIKSSPYVYIPFDLKLFVSAVSNYITIVDLDKMTKTIKSLIEAIPIELHKIKPLNLPPNNIILFSNGVYNSLTSEFANDPSYFGEYDFINNVPYRVNLENPNKFYIELVRKIKSDWADGNKDKYSLLNQFSLAAMEGDGRNKYVFLKGDCGNGKSTFLHILSKLVGSDYRVDLDLQDISDDNKLGRIQSHTKLITGHDLAIGHKLGDKQLSRFKKLALGEPITVNMNYKKAKDVVFKGLKIQNTNKNFNFFENSNAIKRGTYLVNWTTKNFSVINKDIKLDDLIFKDTEDSVTFMESYIYSVLAETKPFTNFIEVKSVN